MSFLLKKELGAAKTERKKDRAKGGGTIHKQCLQHFGLLTTADVQHRTNATTCLTTAVVELGWVDIDLRSSLEPGLIGLYC